MMKLFEDYKNLNILDRSLFNTYRNGDTFKMQGSPITPDSEIYIEKVTPHNFTSAMAMLDDETIAALVFRAHNRQLIMVSKNNDLIRKYGYYQDYMAILTNYAYNKCNDYYDGVVVRSDREAPIKTAVSRIIKSFYEKAPEGTRKQWDVLVIKVDPTYRQKPLDRAKSKEGSVPVPSDLNYGSYMDKLRDAFNQRAREFIDSRRPDYQSIDEIANFMLSSNMFKTIKVRGIVYELQNEHLELNTEGRENRSYLLYKTTDASKTPSEAYYLYIFFRFNGFKPEFIKAVPGDRWTNSYQAGYNIGNTSISF